MPLRKTYNYRVKSNKRYEQVTEKAQKTGQEILPGGGEAGFTEEGI